VQFGAFPFGALNRRETAQAVNNILWSKRTMKQHTTKSNCDCLRCKLVRAGVCENCAYGIAGDAEAGFEDPRAWRACAPCREVIKQHFEAVTLRVKIQADNDEELMRLAQEVKEEVAKHGGIITDESTVN
jgi:hypothetical protein